MSQRGKRVRVFWGLHATEHALRSQLYTPLELLVATEGAKANSLVDAARTYGVVIRNVSPLQLKKIANPRARQAVLFCHAKGTPPTLRSIIEASHLQAHSLILLCDGVTDAHNIGAITRAAHHFGASAVVLSNHSSQDEAAIAHASTGSSFYVPVLTHHNIGNALNLLRTHNYWVIGADMAGKSLYAHAVEYQHLALVVGDEERGLRKNTQHLCDLLLSLPRSQMAESPPESLNVSVATGIFLYELTRHYHQP